jgi:hypothetical protein
MKSIDQKFKTFGRLPTQAAVLPAMGLACSLCAVVIGCSSGSSSKVTPPAQEPSQLYFAPNMGSGSLATYSIDHTANTFNRTTYSVEGAFVTDSGSIAALPSGTVSLGTTFLSGIGGSVDLSNPLTGSYAIEIPGEVSLLELDTPAEVTTDGFTIPAANVFTPGVATQDCPSLPKVQTFQFVTIPRQLTPANTNTIVQNAWNPILETAYGSVQISTEGSTVNFGSVSQSTFPLTPGGTSTAPSFPGPSTASAACSTTYFGQTISYPAADTVSNSGTSASATIAISPSGFLLEDSGTSTGGQSSGLSYENLLGAGFGAIGLPVPSSDPTTSLIGSQFQGFLYSPGTSSAFSLISSFGIPSSQAACANLVAEITAAKLSPSSNTIYGGEFTGNNPSANPNPNCDIAIDLGMPQGSTSNGLYTNATVYVGTAYPENGLGSLYSFPAVAVAGEIRGQYAVFLLGVDKAGTPQRAWGIYLLQSNKP